MGKQLENIIAERSKWSRYSSGSCIVERKREDKLFVELIKDRASFSDLNPVQLT